ncbi:MAG: hypothetical protein V7K39_07845, partial [Nostoc sp.]
MNIDRLQELKQKLTNEADLSHIWLFYMDHFADHSEFTELGEPAYNEYLDNVLQKTCEQMFDRAIKIRDLRKNKVPVILEYLGSADLPAPTKSLEWK